MLNFPVKYKIVFIKDKTGVIATNHKNKELFISKDIKLNITDDGKLCAMFQKDSKTDCSVTISDPSRFNHCVQKGGTYQLSGSGVTFNGTDGEDTLILNGCENSKIDMGSGNDAVLYREKKLLNNNINMGEGNNIFASTGKTDADRALIQNNISSGKGNDFIYLRNAVGNTISSGGGDDLIEIEGASQSKFPNYFANNTINSEDGNDSVNVLGNFEKFSGNSFYLGKGSDTFNSSINKNYDARKESDYNDKLPEYLNTVSDTAIYATDGEKGWFEKDFFNSDSYTSNKLILNGFESKNVTTKSIPHDVRIAPLKPDSVQAPRKLTREDYSRRYSLGSLGWNLFRDPKFQEMAFKACDDYVKSMVSD